MSLFIQRMQSCGKRYFAANELYEKTIQGGHQLVVYSNSSLYITVNVYPRTNKIMIQPGDYKESHIISFLKCMPIIGASRVTEEIAESSKDLHNTEQDVAHSIPATSSCVPTPQVDISVQTQTNLLHTPQVDCHKLPMHGTQWVGNVKVLQWKQWYIMCWARCGVCALWLAYGES